MRCPVCKSATQVRCIFNALDKEAAAQARHSSRIISCRQGEIIFQQGTAAPDAALLCHGKAQLACRTPQGERILLQLLRSGEVFGVTGLAGQPRRCTCALALEDVQVRFITHADLRRFCVHYPAVAEALIAQLAEGRGQVCRWLALMAGANAREKVIHLLLLLSEAYGADAEDGARRIDLQLTEKELGEMAGLSRATMSRELSQLREQGLIERNSQLAVIRDMIDLKRLVSDM